MYGQIFSRAEEAARNVAGAARQSAEHAAEAQHYTQVAKEHATYWRGKTAGGQDGATRRTFDQPGSFSAKTNLVFDVLLDTQLFPGLVPKECAVLRETSGPFGWLLDERGLQTNKTNIETELVVALCSDDDQNDYYQRILRFLATTPAGWQSIRRLLTSSAFPALAPLTRC